MEEIATDPDAASDTRFIQLYKLLLAGKIDTARTRLPISDIVSGYYERRDNGIVKISSAKPENVRIMERAIRAGSRPSLVLYWCPFAPGGGVYVCSDDEAAFAAYHNLSFSLVPCSILRPKNVDALEASIWLKNQGEYVGIARAVPPKVESVPIFAHDKAASFSDFVQFLIGKCEKTRNDIISFHRQVRSDIHYHQMLHAFVRRHERVLDSIGRMIELGRAEHAEALMRTAYEGFLNFYVDWLSPEFFGPRLQILSTIRTAQAEGQINLHGYLLPLANFVDFLENSTRKAEISPLGKSFHNRIYPSLSLVVHQSYSHLESESVDFNECGSKDPLWRRAYIQQYLNAITAAILLRVQNDVGLGADALIEHC